MRICKHIRCIMETMFSRRRHMFICMKKQMGCRKRKFMISPDCIKKFIFISIFAVVTIMQLRLFCYPQSDCWTDEEISGLVFCSYRKYGYKWTYGRYDSMSIHQYPYYHTYLLCESTEMGYGYFERFLNMLLDNLYYRPM